MTIIKGFPCHSRCDTLKNRHCSMAMSVEHRSKFAALHRHYEWKILEWDEKTQANKQTCTLSCMYLLWFINTTLTWLFPNIHLVYFIGQKWKYIRDDKRLDKHMFGTWKPSISLGFRNIPVIFWRPKLISFEGFQIDRFWSESGL